MNQPQSEPQKEKQQKLILLIEDDPLLIKMYTAKFINDGYQVVNTQDGEEGLKLALEGKADLILLDIMMPKLSGIDLLARFKQEYHGKEIPILILSNLTQEESVKKAKELGAREYLVKADYTPAQIVGIIKKYIG